MAKYWNHYFGQWLDEEDNDIPNDMPNDRPNDNDEDDEDCYEEDLDEKNIIHFDESELEWWKELQEKINNGTLFKNNWGIEKCSRK